MFRRLGHALMIVAVITATGTHWTVLQSVAWTGMFASNLSSAGFAEAIEKTFDGNHPCPLCKAIATGKKSESKKEFTPQFQKLEFPHIREDIVLFAPSDFQLLPAAQTSADSYLSRPPVPPPRGNCA